eukprot:m.434745 g.434745  ORF g.434745 m.434745 type:complete len:106 (-) comp98516_c0_seq1:112-429(-)
MDEIVYGIRVKARTQATYHLTAYTVIVNNEHDAFCTSESCCIGKKAVDLVVRLEKYKKAVKKVGSLYFPLERNFVAVTATPRFGTLRCERGVNVGSCERKRLIFV